jgi:Tol biopolymer transport system component
MLVSEQTNLLQVYDVSASTPKIVLEETIEADQVIASPDGGFVAVATGARGQASVVIYQLSPFSEVARIEDATLGQYLEIDPGVWSPDGGRLLTRQAACTEAERLVAYDIASGQSTELASGFGYTYRFGFSPDGEWVAFTTHPTNAHVVPADGSAAAEQVDGNVTAPVQPLWTQDSVLVAFTQFEDGGYDICLGP